MAVKQFALPANRAFDSNGRSSPNAVARLYTSGTLTPRLFYSDLGLTTPLGVSMTASPSGKFATPAYQDSSTAFRVIIEDANGAQLDDIDPFYFGDPESSALRSDLAADSGTSLIGTPSGDSLADVLNDDAGGAGGVIDWRWAGMAGDGTTDDTSALQAAVNQAIALGCTLHLPPAFKAGAITVNGPCRIQGVRSRSVQTSIAGSYTGWTIGSSDVEICNLQINDASKTGGYDFLLACGTSTVERVTIKNVLTFDGFGCVTDSGSGSGCHITTILEDIQARRQRGPGFSFTRLFGFGSWTRLTADFVGVSASNYTGFAIDGTGLGASAGGLTINDCNVLGTAGVYANTSQIGYNFANFSDITISVARADSCAGDGFRFTNTNKLEIGKALSQLCDGHGHVLTTVINADIHLLRATGRNTLSGTASKDGVQIVSGCFGLSIDRIFARDLTGNGLNIAATQAGDVDVGRVQMLSNTGRGVVTVGTSAVNIGGGQMSGNTAGNLDVGGALHFIDGLQISNGTKADYGPGPVTA